MNENTRITILLFIFSVLFCCLSSAQNTDFEPYIEVTKIQDDLYVLAMFNEPQSSPTNSILSIGDDGILLIDHAGEWRDMSVSKEFGNLVSQKIAELSGGKGTPDYIINTHWHGDHTGANLLWGARASIIAHENTYKRLSQPQNPFWSEQTLGPIPETGWPNITFQDSLNLYLNGHTIQLLNFGIAHTDGDAIVYFKEAGLIHMGDLYHGHLTPTQGADAVGLQHTYASILKRVPDSHTKRIRIVTGHAGITDYSELQDHSDLYKETISFVHQKLEEGLQEKEILDLGLPSKLQSTWEVDEETKKQHLQFVISSVLARQEN